MRWPNLFYNSILVALTIIVYIQLQIAFTFLVYPALILAYMGQAAYLSMHHDASSQISFYVSVPGIPFGIVYNLVSFLIVSAPT